MRGWGLVDGPVRQLLPGRLAILVFAPLTLLRLGLSKVRRGWGWGGGWAGALAIGSLTWRIANSKTCNSGDILCLLYSFLFYFYTKFEYGSVITLLASRYSLRQWVFVTSGVVHDGSG